MIIGASPIEDDAVFREFPPENYYVICADAGYETAERYGITPDLVVGDFDSAKTLPPKGNKVLTLPVEKDVTDTMYAVIKGFAKGYRSFVLVGCLGGARFDHSLANLEVLQYILQHSGYGVMADSHTKVFLIAGSRLRLTEMKGRHGVCVPLRHRQLHRHLPGAAVPPGPRYPHQRRGAHGREQHHHCRYRRHPGPRGHGLGGGLHGRNTFCPFGYTG